MFKKMLIFIVFLFLVACSKENEFYIKGIKMMDNSNYKEAILLFEQAIEIDEKNVDIYHSLALAYYSNGDFEMAMDILQQGYEITGDESLKAHMNSYKNNDRSHLSKKKSLSNLEFQYELYPKDGIEYVMKNDLDASFNKMREMFGSDLNANNTWEQCYDFNTDYSYSRMSDANQSVENLSHFYTLENTYLDSDGDVAIRNNIRFLFHVNEETSGILRDGYSLSSDSQGTKYGKPAEYEIAIGKQFYAEGESTPMEIQFTLSTDLSSGDNMSLKWTLVDGKLKTVSLHYSYYSDYTKSKGIEIIYVVDEYYEDILKVLDAAKNNVKKMIEDMRVACQYGDISIDNYVNLAEVERVIMDTEIVEGN